MTILMLDKYLAVGGVATFLKTLCRGLTERGYTIYLITADDGKNSKTIQEFREYEVRVFTVPYSENKLICYYLFLKSALKLIKNKNIDLIHSHTRLTHFVAITAGKMKRLPRLLTLHIFKKDYKRLINRWKKEFITVPSKALKKHLIDYYGLNEERVQVIPNAVAPDFEVNEKLVSLFKKNTFTRPDAFYVCYIGRFTPEKGVDTLIKSIPDISKRNPNIAFRIFGWGPEKTALKEICHNHDLDPELIFKGTNTNVNELLSAADLCVIPSRSESFSLLALEAMRAGTPVVATGVGGLPEVIKDGETGLLIEPDDPKALAEAILKLYNNEEMRKEFSRNGKVRFNQAFSIDKFYESYITEYSNLTGR